MPSNNLSGLVHYLAGAYPGKIGMMLSPQAGWKNPPFYMPFAIDNGGFKAFDPIMFKLFLNRASLMRSKPLFVVVPDVHKDAESTNRLWHEWNKKIPFNLAFVAQDGHEPRDIPQNAFAVFVGGSNDFRSKNAHKFKGVSPWLHIGRVSTPDRILWAHEIGADSIDGTGFFRSGRRILDLIEYMTGSGQQKIPGF